MSKGTVAGIVIALVAGAMIGYLVLPMVFQSEGTEQDILWDQYDPAVSIPDFVDTPIPNLVVNFSTSTGDSILITYTCWVALEPLVLPNWLGITVRVAIDGSVETSSQTIHRYWFDSDHLSYQPFGMRYVKAGLSPGAHNVTVIVNGFGDYDVRQVNQSILSVQIF